MNGPTHTTLAALISDKARTNPDLKILTFVTVGADDQLEDQTRTYRQLCENSQALARGLAGLGVSQGDKLAVMMNNHPEFVETMVASGILGRRIHSHRPSHHGRQTQLYAQFHRLPGRDLR